MRGLELSAIVRAILATRGSDGLEEFGETWALLRYAIGVLLEHALAHDDAERLRRLGKGACERGKTAWYAGVARKKFGAILEAVQQTLQQARGIALVLCEDTGLVVLERLIDEGDGRPGPCHDLLLRPADLTGRRATGRATVGACACGIAVGRATVSATVGACACGIAVGRTTVGAYACGCTVEPSLPDEFELVVGLCRSLCRGRPADEMDQRLSGIGKGSVPVEGEGFETSAPVTWCSGSEQSKQS